MFFIVSLVLNNSATILERLPLAQTKIIAVSFVFLSCVSFESQLGRSK